MRISGTMLGVRNLVTVCVDHYDGDIHGEAWHCYNTEPIRFDGADSLALSLDRLFDRLGMPQQESWFRSFSGGKRVSTAPEAYDPPDKKQDQAEILEKNGREATFAIHVQYRKNATWQGSLFWAEGGQWFLFRSALELLKIMDHLIRQGKLPQQKKQPANARLLA